MAYERLAADFADIDYIHFVHYFIRTYFDQFFE